MMERRYGYMGFALLATLALVGIYFAVFYEKPPAPQRGDSLLVATTTPTQPSSSTPVTVANPLVTKPKVPSAAQLLAVAKKCVHPSAGKYRMRDEDTTETVSICRLSNAYFWKADLEVDCDGAETPACNLTTDPQFQNQTSIMTSGKNWPDASALPYIVIPLPSKRFNYEKAGIELGDVAAVVYQGKVVYGVFADEGPEHKIGEASYAMAKALGIDPDPSTGGADNGALFFVFTGKDAKVEPMESHARATALGQLLAARLIADN